MSIVLLLRISKPHLVQAGRSSYKSSKSHACKIGGYRYFKPLCLAIQILCRSISTKYPTLKLSSMSRSNALILAHIIKNNFNSAYCSYLIVTVSTSDHSYCTCAGDVRSKYVVFSLLFIYVCLSQMFSTEKPSVPQLSCCTRLCWSGEACIILPWSHTRSSAAV